jgi:hypothetical protein
MAVVQAEKGNRAKARFDETARRAEAFLRYLSPTPRTPRPLPAHRETKPANKAAAETTPDACFDDHSVARLYQIGQVGEHSNRVWRNYS